jgi:hypothetical protein
LLLVLPLPYFALVAKKGDCGVVMTRGLGREFGRGGPGSVVFLIATDLAVVVGTGRRLLNPKDSKELAVPRLAELAVGEILSERIRWARLAAVGRRRRSDTGATVITRKCFCDESDDVAGAKARGRLASRAVDVDFVKRLLLAPPPHTFDLRALNKVVAVLMVSKELGFGFSGCLAACSLAKVWPRLAAVPTKRRLDTSIVTVRGRRGKFDSGLAAGRGVFRTRFVGATPPGNGLVACDLAPTVLLLLKAVRLSVFAAVDLVGTGFAATIEVLLKLRLDGAGATCLLVTTTDLMRVLGREVLPDTGVDWFKGLDLTGTDLTDRAIVLRLVA